MSEQQLGTTEDAAGAHHDVFISYSHKNKTQADAICAYLESRGIRCWLASRDAQPGVSWAKSIIHGINGARVFVLVFSSFANASAQVSREVERAANRQLPILPFRIEDVAPNETLEYFISSPHWMDAIDPPLQAHIERLEPAVKALLSAQSQGAATAGGGESAKAEGETSQTVAALQNHIQEMRITASYGSVGKKILGVIAAMAGVWLLIHLPSALASGPQNAAGVGIICIGCFGVAGLLWR
jgi:TIR domain